MLGFRYVIYTEEEIAAMKKRIISVVLSLAIILGSAVTAFAAPSSKSSASASGYNGYPFVLIRGMNFNGLYYKLGTDEEQNCFKGVKVGEVLSVAAKAIATGVFRWSYDEAVDVINEYLVDIMGLMACNPDGSSKYDVSVTQYPLSVAHYPELWDAGDQDELGILKGAVERYGAENVYYYNYDWRLDPYIHADNINALVNRAIKDTGKKKVNLACCSMGGILTVAYMDKYGSSKLNRVMFLSSTIGGTHVTTDLLNGTVEVDPYNLYIFAVQKLAYDNKPLEILFKTLYYTGVFNGLSKIANSLIPKLKDRVYKGFLRDTFGTIPTVWANVLPEGYDEAVKYMFGGEESKYSGIIKLSKSYQQMVSRREKMLKNAEKSGTNICLVAGYGSAVIPVYPGGGCNGDSILEADRMLCGAVVAPLGSTLGDNYKAKDASRVSPDNIVDLSTGIFPSTSWAIYGSRHVCGDYHSDYADFIFSINDYYGKCTVKSLPDYPQFMKADHDGNLYNF